MGLLDDQDFDMQGYGGLLGPVLYRGTPPSESGLAEQARVAAAARLASGIRNNNRTYAGGVFQAGSAPFGFAGPGSLNFGTATSTPDLSAFEPAREPEEQGPMPDDVMSAQMARNNAAARLARGTRSINRANAPPLTFHDLAGVVRSGANALPIVGPVLNKADAATNAFIAPAINPFLNPEDRLSEATLGERYDHALRVQNEMDEKFVRDNPHLDAMAKFAGRYLGWKGLSQALPWALGSAGGSLPERMVRGAGTRAAISGVDAAERGEDPGDAARRGAVKGFFRPARRQLSGS